MEITIKQALKQGINAHKKGNVKDAKRFYQAILKSQPSHPDANHNLGLIAVSTNKPKLAIPLFLKALQVNPDIEQFWLSYIDALIKAKFFKEASKAIKKAKKKGFDAEKLDTLLYKSRGINDTKIPSQKQLFSLSELYQNGKFIEAEKLALQITKNFPMHQLSWKFLGAVLGVNGKKFEAVNACQKAVELSPQDAEAHNNLGNTLQELGRLDEAEASYKQAIAMRSDYAEAHYNLGNTLKEQGKLEAEASYKQAIMLKPNYAKAHNNLGNILKQLGRLSEAKDSYNQAIALKPDYAEAHYNLGNTLKELGKLGEAEASFNHVIALKPDHSEAHLALTSLKKFDVQDEQYLKMLELYNNEMISEEQRCHINFSLAKACEDLEDFEQAMSHYNEGNKLRKKMLNYDISEDLELFQQIISNYPKIKQNTLEPFNFSKNLIPIFIVGMPRSGTTLVEQIISCHPLVTGAGELPYVAQFGTIIANGFSEINNTVLIDFRNKYLSKLCNVSNGNSIITDKMPQNFRFIGLLLAAFPEAKIIHVKRNPAAVCWANYKQYFVSKTLGYCYALDDIVSYHKLYKNLMDFWVKKLGERIYNLDYEQLTINQEIETRQVIDYLGLDWDEKCLSPQNNTRSVATASNLQIRKKVYKGSSELWKKYQPFLKGALDGLLSP